MAPTINMGASAPSFTCFQKLPYELRCMIYAETLPDARKVALHFEPEVERGAYRFITCSEDDYCEDEQFQDAHEHAITTPPAAETCSEARREILRTHNTKVWINSKHVWLDPSRLDIQFHHADGSSSKITPEVLSSLSKPPTVCCIECSTPFPWTPRRDDAIPLKDWDLFKSWDECQAKALCIKCDTKKQHAAALARCLQRPNGAYWASQLRFPGILENALDV